MNNLSFGLIACILLGFLGSSVSTATLNIPNRKNVSINTQTCILAETFFNNTINSETKPYRFSYNKTNAKDLKIKSQESGFRIGKLAALHTLKNFESDDVNNASKTTTAPVSPPKKTDTNKRSSYKQNRPLLLLQPYPGRGVSPLPKR